MGTRKDMLFVVPENLNLLFIIQGIYGNLMCNLWDLSYTESVIKYVMKQVINCQGDSFTLGSATFPIPPAASRKWNESMIELSLNCALQVNLSLEQGT